MIERHESKQVPSFLQAEPLTNYVGLKPESDQRLQTLIHNIFNKVFMVRDYPTALQVAKDYQVTCVTPDL